MLFFKSFFFSICCLAKSAVTNANAPPAMLANPIVAVPLNARTIVIPSVPIDKPHGICYLFYSYSTDICNNIVVMWLTKRIYYYL